MIRKTNKKNKEPGDLTEVSLGRLERKVELLLVDDRPQNLLALEAVLESSDYSVVKASSGDEALRYLLDREPAVILMDVQMPTLDGYETAAIIKRSKRTREIPIIFITALNQDDGHLHKGYDHGAVDYIYKPFDAHVLRSKVSVFAELARKTKRLIQAERIIRDNEVKDRERQLAQLELKSLKREYAIQKKHRELIEGIEHSVVWSVDAETYAISFVSQSAERILGFPIEQWTSEAGFLTNHLLAEDRPLFAAAVARAKKEKHEVGLDHRFITSDLRQLWFHTGIRFSQIDENSSGEIRGISTDITMLKEAEAVLKQNKLQSEFLSEAGLVLSESLDVETILACITKLAVPRLANWCSLEALDGRNQIKTLSLAHSESPDRTFPNPNPVSPEILSVLQGGKSQLYEFIPDSVIDQLACRDGFPFSREELSTASMITVPVIARSKILGAMSFLSIDRVYEPKDLSLAQELALRAALALDNAQLYKQAQAAIQVRDDFLSIASHELRTPLTPLKVQTQLLLRTLKMGSYFQMRPEKIEEILRVSDGQLVRLSRLIDNLLDISKINSGKLSLQTEEFDLPELVRENLERFASQFVHAGCEVELFLPTSLKVRWDRLRTEQVLTNLITNAMKYGSGKPVQISVKQVGSHSELSVRDQGMGIAKKDQDRIFGRFERAVSGNYIAGLGLGLYIVSQIVESHGGIIQLKSEPGEGSTFTVRLPIEVHEHDFATPSRGEGIPTQLTEKDRNQALSV